VYICGWNGAGVGGGYRAVPEDLGGGRSGQVSGLVPQLSSQPCCRGRGHQGSIKLAFHVSLQGSFFRKVTVTLIFLLNMCFITVY
jgi:hypothetical protein